MPITLNPAASAAVRPRCPLCGYVSSDAKPMRLEDGDTFHSDEGRALGGRFDCAYMWGPCPDCGEILYELQLTAVSAVPDGFHFYRDNCHKHERELVCVATRGKAEWLCILHMGVRDASCCDVNPQTRQPERVFDAEWMAQHDFPLVAGRDRFMRMGRKIVAEIGPETLLPFQIIE
jgi:hypothetical protein